MDLGFLSGLLGKGENNTALTMLLPLLLGKNTSSGGFGGIGDILCGLLNKKPTKESGFPPLFGENGDRGSDQNPLFAMLGDLIGASKNEKTAPKPQTEYPYELQYNRPL